MRLRIAWRMWLVVVVGLMVLAACAPADGAEDGGDAPGEVEDDQGMMDDDMMDDDDDTMGDDDDMMDDDHEEGDEDEHVDDMEAQHLHMDPPEEYQGLDNPLEGDADAIAAGEVIYTANCETCHGESGKGDGPAAEALDPQPADFTDQAMMMDMSDSYLFWRVTEGGAFEPFNSAMPPWGQALTEDERWQVISYIRTLDD